MRQKQRGIATCHVKSLILNNYQKQQGKQKQRKYKEKEAPLRPANNIIPLKMKAVISSIKEPSFFFLHIGNILVLAEVN